MRLLFCVFLLLSTPAFADVFVITNSQTNEVISAINKDEAVLESGQVKTVIKGKNIEDFDLQRHPSDYKLVKNNFTLNSKKILDKENKEIEDAKTFENMKTNKMSAINKLKVLGLTDDEIKALLN